MNGLEVYTIMGPDNVVPVKRSPTVPPATLKKADPAKPVMNRATSNVAIWPATAHGTSHTKKTKMEPM
jgi:hypothetical protein